MRIHTNPFWVFYFQEEEVRLDSDKCGKWMYFFSDKTFVASICQKIVESGVVQKAKHSNAESGVACFYIEYDDLQAHKRVIQFMLDNNLIQKTKAGKLHNISFKLDTQTLAGEYGADFKAEIKLADFVDLDTGKWKIEESTNE